MGLQALSSIAKKSDAELFSVDVSGSEKTMSRSVRKEIRKRVEIPLSKVYSLSHLKELERTERAQGSLRRLREEKKVGAVVCD